MVPLFYGVHRWLKCQLCEFSPLKVNEIVNKISNWMILVETYNIDGTSVTATRSTCLQRNDLTQRTQPLLFTSKALVFNYEQLHCDWLSIHFDPLSKYDQQSESVRSCVAYSVITIELTKSISALYFRCVQNQFGWSNEISIYKYTFIWNILQDIISISDGLKIKQ